MGDLEKDAKWNKKVRGNKAVKSTWWITNNNHLKQHKKMFVCWTHIVLLSVV